MAIKFISKYTGSPEDQTEYMGIIFRKNKGRSELFPQEENI